MVFLCQCRVDPQVRTSDAVPELMCLLLWIELGLTHAVFCCPVSLCRLNLQQQWHSLSQGCSDEAAAGLDKVVPVSCYVLETLLLHLFSEMGRPEKEEDRMLGDGAHTTWYQRVICGILKTNIV